MSVHPPTLNSLAERYQNERLRQELASLRGESGFFEPNKGLPFDQSTKPDHMAKGGLFKSSEIILKK
jgi:hypothetical protein